LEPLNDVQKGVTYT